MHIDVAREMKEKLVDFKKRSIRENEDFFGIKEEYNENEINRILIRGLIGEIEFIKFVIENGNELSSNICKTILSKMDSRGNLEKYFRITDKQKYCVTQDIMSKFTYEQIIEKCFGN